MELLDDMEIVCLMLTRANFAGPLLRMVLGSRTSRSESSIQGFVEEIVPLQPLDDFRRYFRVHRSTFMILVRLLASCRMNVTGA